MDNEAEKAALPGRVESELAIGSWQSAEAAGVVVAAQFDLRCGHLGPLGLEASAVPTMESRLINGTSSSAVIPSVPSGRCGITRYRTSALLSHTSILTVSGRLSPNSARTLRGSLTTRARYWGYLNHAGGIPSSVQG